MCLFIFFFIGAVALIVWTLQGIASKPDVVHARVPTFVGAFLVITSFTSMPWVHFAPFNYLIDIGMGPDIFLEQASETIAFVFRHLGQKGVARLFSFIAWFGFIPGWALIFLIPSQAIFVRLVIALVGIVGVLSALWVPISLFIQNETIQRIIGVLQAIFAFLAAFLLLLQMPTIDAWGSKGTFMPGLITLMSGAQLGIGVWVAWIGLLLLGIGGLLGVTVANRANAVPDYNAL